MASDPQDRYHDNQHMIEEEKEEDNSFNLDEGDQLRGGRQTEVCTGRPRADSLVNNIRKYEKAHPRHRNLNDSRENDFDGFGDEIEGVRDSIE